jgi:hypothetical protein
MPVLNMELANPAPKASTQFIGKNEVSTEKPNPGKYPALQVMIVFHRVIAFVWLAFCVFISFSVVSSGLKVGIYVSILGVAGAICILAGGELIQVFLNIEHNTRKGN